MSQRTTALRVASPCPERWAAMTPTAAGRHCAACQKVVVDFTHKTDAEILASLRQAAGETCGRLRADQLGRPLVMPAPAPRWRAWLGAALAIGGALGAGRAAAQSPRTNYYAGPQPLPTASPSGNAAPAEPSHATTTSPATPQPAPGSPYTVRGVVLDASTHEPLPGVTILLKNTTTGTATTMAGTFELPIDPAAQSATITVSMVGYAQQEKTLAMLPRAPLQVELLLDAQVLGGLMVIDYQKPWPWHPRRLFNWGKYWIAKPFRG